MAKVNRARLQMIHAKRRAHQRYGLRLSTGKYRDLVLQIQNWSQGYRDKVKFLYRESCRVTHWEIQVDSVNAHVVYDKVRKTIVTFLP